MTDKAKIHAILAEIYAQPSGTGWLARVWPWYAQLSVKVRRARIDQLKRWLND